jgi:hypothetical protein
MKQKKFSHSSCISLYEKNIKVKSLRVQMHQNKVSLEIVVNSCMFLAAALVVPILDERRFFNFIRIEQLMALSHIFEARILCKSFHSLQGSSNGVYSKLSVEQDVCELPSSPPYVSSLLPRGRSCSFRRTFFILRGLLHLLLFGGS